MGSQKPKEEEREAQPGSLRSAKTRQRLIESAIEVFGVHGFEGTTTRMLVRQAGTQLTAISYYFNNKEGLYQAAAEYIARSLSSRLDQSIHSVHPLLASPSPSSAELVEAVSGLLDHFTELLVGPAIPDTWARFVSRELSEPSLAFDLLFSSMQPFGRTLCQLIAQLRQSSPDNPEIVLCMLTLIGQVLVFRLDRAVALRHLNWPEFGPSQLDAVRATIRSNVRKLLEKDL